MKSLSLRSFFVILILGLIPVIGLFGYFGYQNTELPQDTILRPTTIETLTKEPVENGIVEKKFIHGNTEINFSVRVENGVESTPAPDVLLAMQSSYSEPERSEQKRIIAESILEGPQGTGINGTGKVIGLKDSEGNDIYINVNQAWKNNQIHINRPINNILKKNYIDTNFTCDNYGKLAKMFVGESMYGVGYAGSVENYIFTKAFNECINPKYQEQVDKVYHELNETNATSLEEVNVND